MKFEFSQQIIDKYSNIKFHENPSSGSRAVPCGQTDISQFCYASKNRRNLLVRVATSCKFCTMRLKSLELLPRQTTMLQEAFVLLLVHVKFFSGSQNQQLIFNKKIWFQYLSFNGDSVLLPVD
jgi:hypothetical protein